MCAGQELKNRAVSVRPRISLRHHEEISDETSPWCHLGQESVVLLFLEDKESTFSFSTKVALSRVDLNRRSGVM